MSRGQTYCSPVSVSVRGDRSFGYTVGAPVALLQKALLQKAFAKGFAENVGFKKGLGGSEQGRNLQLLRRQFHA